MEIWDWTFTLARDPPPYSNFYRGKSWSNKHGEITFYPKTNENYMYLLYSVALLSYISPAECDDWRNLYTFCNYTYLYLLSLAIGGSFKNKLIFVSGNGTDLSCLYILLFIERLFLLLDYRFSSCSLKKGKI